MPQEPGSYLMPAPGGPGNPPQSASPEGSVGRQQQHPPPQWPSVASGQPSRLSQAAFPPPLPEPAPGYAGPLSFLGAGMGPLLVTPGAAAPTDGWGFAGPSFSGPDLPVPALLGLPGVVPHGQPGSPVRQSSSPIGQPSQPVLGPSGLAHSATVPPGVIYGLDGQWIRLRPGVNPAPPHPPPPGGRGRGRGSPPR